MRGTCKKAIPMLGNRYQNNAHERSSASCLINHFKLQFFEIFYSNLSKFVFRFARLLLYPGRLKFGSILSLPIGSF